MFRGFHTLSRLADSLGINLLSLSENQQSGVLYLVVKKKVLTESAGDNAMGFYLLRKPVQHAVWFLNLRKTYL